VSSTSSDSPDRFVDRHFQHYAGRLNKFVAKRVQRGESVEEIVQITWSRLLDVKDPDGISNPLAYILRTARNALCDYRVQRAACPLSEPQPDDSELERPFDSRNQSDPLFNSVLSLQTLELVLREMQPHLREILVLRTLVGFPDSSIALILGFKPLTIATYHSQALAQARDLASSLNPPVQPLSPRTQKPTMSPGLAPEAGK
jgi:RNA polymerase sigma factor (sigma-70 family)